ncbi:MAG: hypothetical protein QW758_01210 [Candidatus Aenigmatarchaeota archaeon]
MKFKNLVVGAFVGTIMMNILMPFIITKGTTNKELILLYTLPLVGTLTSLILEIENEERKNNLKKITNSEIKESKAIEKDLNVSSFLGKEIKIRTYSGAFISGILKGIEDNLLILSSAKRLDVPESIVSSIIFIDRKDIREIELSNETTSTSF